MAQINDYTGKTTAADTDEYILQEISGGLTKKITRANLVKPERDDITALQNNPSLPYGYLQGLNISNGTDTDHQIDIATGRCKDSTGVQDIISDSVITIDIEDLGVNGLDVGTVAADTWYYPWLIYNPTTDTEAGLLSLNATSPTLPSGYTYFRKVRGAVLTDSSSNILGFTQNDNHFIFNTRIRNLNLSTQSTSKTNFSISTPDSLTVVGLFAWSARDGASSYVNVFGANQADRTPAQDNSDVICESGNSGNGELTRIAENAILSYRANRTTMDNLSIWTLGFIDNAEL